MRELPVVAVLLGVLAGLVLVVLGDWRLGCDVVGVAVVGAGGLRLGLRERDAGLLAVRGRALDAGLLLGLGAAVLLLAGTVPSG